MSKVVEAIDFIKAQRQFDNCKDLAIFLDKTESAVRARINWFIKNGNSSKLRKYDDLAGHRGRKPVAKQLADLVDYDERDSETPSIRKYCEEWESEYVYYMLYDDTTKGWVYCPPTILIDTSIEQIEVATV